MVHTNLSHCDYINSLTKLHMSMCARTHFIIVTFLLHNPSVSLTYITNVGISELQSCDSELCIQHGGHCMNNITVGNNCTCLGVINCTIPITDCSCSTDNNPCYNGTCWDSNDGAKPKCNCTDGWIDEYCDVDKDYCPDSYCQPHGICVEGLGTEYHCTCEETYRGELCDELFCPVDYCYNNGTCSILNGTSINCICMIGYYGDRCENEGTIYKYSRTTLLRTELRPAF